MHGILCGQEMFDNCVSGFVISRSALFLFLDDAGLLLRTDDDFDICLLDLLHPDELLPLACSKQRGFVKEVGQICACKACGGFGDRFEIDGFFQRLIAGMHLQDFYTAFDIGIIDGNLPVETAGTQQRGIQNIRAVGGGNNDDAVIYSKAVHFYKKLVQLRKEMEVISEGKIEFLMKEDENVLAYRRYTDSQEMLVMCNLTSEEAPVTLPQGWENTDVLIANWDNATALTDLTLRPYECLALIK